VRNLVKSVLSDILDTAGGFVRRGLGEDALDLAAELICAVAEIH
jgi:hypothetical protein